MLPNRNRHDKLLTSKANKENDEMENLNQTEICKARFHASDLAECLVVAYWMTGADKAWHLKEAERSLVSLLDVIRSGKAE